MTQEGQAGHERESELEDAVEAARDGLTRARGAEHAARAHRVLVEAIAARDAAAAEPERQEPSSVFGREVEWAEWIRELDARLGSAEDAAPGRMGEATELVDAGLQSYYGRCDIHGFFKVGVSGSECPGCREDAAKAEDAERGRRLVEAIEMYGGHGAPHQGDPGDEDAHVSRRRAVQVHVEVTMQYRSSHVPAQPSELEQSGATRRVEMLRAGLQQLLDDGLIEGFHVKTATFDVVPG